jgi:hypothetical protein
MLISARFCAYAEIDPYSFYPSKVYKSRDKVFTKSKKMMAVAPARPMAVKDKNGNITYSTADGEVMVRIDTSGSRTFFLKGSKRRAKNSKNEKEKTWETDTESGRVIIRNEFGEKLGEEEYKGDKVIAEYDAQGNRTKTYKYNKYGKRMEWVVDELTLTKTVYNENGKALYDLNFEGYKVATYEYDDNDRLKTKTDVYDNTTFYSEDGRQLKTLDIDGNAITTYNYKKTKFYYELDSVKDEYTGDVTIYREGKPQEVRNAEGALVKTYEWQGSKLIFVADESGEITWYNDGKQAYTTVNGYLAQEWIYHKGKLAGIWNEQDNSFLLYTHGRKELELHFEEKPSIEKILGFYEKMGMKI